MSSRPSISGGMSSGLPPRLNASLSMGMRALGTRPDRNRAPIGLRRTRQVFPEGSSSSSGFFQSFAAVVTWPPFGLAGLSGLLSWNRLGDDSRSLVVHEVPQLVRGGGEPPA